MPSMFIVTTMSTVSMVVMLHRVKMRRMRVFHGKPPWRCQPVPFVFR
jgi:hypothetical protein